MLQCYNLFCTAATLLQPARMLLLSLYVAPFLIGILGICLVRRALIRERKNYIM